jgi:uncharacterized protein
MNHPSKGEVSKAAADPKELVIVPHADRVDLYNQMAEIPSGRLEAFFRTNLKQSS